MRLRWFYRLSKHTYLSGNVLPRGRKIDVSRADTRKTARFLAWALPYEIVLIALLALASSPVFAALAVLAIAAGIVALIVMYVRGVIRRIRQLKREKNK